MKGASANTQSEDHFRRAQAAFKRADITALEDLTNLSSFPHGTDAFVGQRWLTTAINSSNIDAVRWVLSKGVDVNAADDMTPLEAAIFNRPPKLYGKAYVPGTPETEAAHTARTIQIIDLLLDAGADINALRDGCAALHLAVRFASIDVVKHLVARGADPAIAGRDRWDLAEAEMIAAELADQLGRNEIAAFLRAHAKV